MPGRRKTSSWLGNLSLYYFSAPDVSEAQLRKKLRPQVQLGNEGTDGRPEKPRRTTGESDDKSWSARLSTRPRRKAPELGNRPPSFDNGRIFQTSADRSRFLREVR